MGPTGKNRNDPKKDPLYFLIHGYLEPDKTGELIDFSQRTLGDRVHWRFMREEQINDDEMAEATNLIGNWLADKRQIKPEMAVLAATTDQSEVPKSFETDGKGLVVTFRFKNGHSGKEMVYNGLTYGQGEVRGVGYNVAGGYPKILLVRKNPFQEGRFDIKVPNYGNESFKKQQDFTQMIERSVLLARELSEKFGLQYLGNYGKVSR